MKPLLIAILGVFGTPAFPFAVDDFRSGMTVEELQTYATRRGLDFRTMEGGNGSQQHFIGKLSNFAIDGQFTSCQGVVVAYRRTIDPDIAYANLAEEMLRRHGQPKVALERLPVHQRPGVFGAELKMSWYSGVDRITLGVSPELRDGQEIGRASCRERVFRAV